MLHLSVFFSHSRIMRSALAVMLQHDLPLPQIGKLALQGYRMTSEGEVVNHKVAKLTVRSREEYMPPFGLTVSTRAPNLRILA